MILSNQLKCLKCGDTPYSAHVHDFRHCKCGAMAVDGGMEYIRRLGDPDNIEEMSVSMSKRHVEGLTEAFTDKTRNDLGKVCNLVRYLRDEMGINVSVEEVTE
jgi:hypothetical protein